MNSCGCTQLLKYDVIREATLTGQIKKGILGLRAQKNNIKILKIF